MKQQLINQIKLQYRGREKRQRKLNGQSRMAHKTQDEDKQNRKAKTQHNTEN